MHIHSQLEITSTRVNNAPPSFIRDIFHIWRMQVYDWRPNHSESTCSFSSRSMMFQTRTHLVNPARSRNKFFLFRGYLRWGKCQQSWRNKVTAVAKYNALTSHGDAKIARIIVRIVKSMISSFITVLQAIPPTASCTSFNEINSFSASHAETSCIVPPLGDRFRDFNAGSNSRW